MKKIQKRKSITKRLALGLGVITTIAAPMIGVVACGENNAEDSKAVNAVTAKDLNLPQANKDKLPTSQDKPKPGVTKSGVKFTFTKWDYNVNKGTIAWEVALSKGQVQRTLTASIIGYKTETDKQAVDNVKSKDLDLPSVNPNTFPSNVPRSKDSLTKSGVKYFYSLWDYNNKDGSLKLTIKLSKDDAQGVMNLTLKGFESQDKNDINAIKVSDLKLPKGDSNKYASSYINKPKESKIGKGVSCSFNKWSWNDQTGTISWGVHLTKGDQSRDMTGTITGFKKGDSLSLSIILENIAGNFSKPGNVFVDNKITPILNELNDKNSIGIKDLSIDFSLPNINPIQPYFINFGNLFLYENGNKNSKQWSQDQVNQYLASKGLMIKNGKLYKKDGVAKVTAKNLAYALRMIIAGQSRLEFFPSAKPEPIKLFYLGNGRNKSWNFARPLTMPDQLTPYRQKP